MIITREGGVVAGIDELAFFLRAHGIDLILEKTDGDTMRPGETLLRVEGDEAALLSLERVGLNLLQRMSGMRRRLDVFRSVCSAAVQRRALWAREKHPGACWINALLHLGGGRNTPSWPG